MEDKTCKTCLRSQKGFFRPHLLLCGIGEQMAEVEPDGWCEWGMWLVVDDAEAALAGKEVSQNG